MDLKEKILRMNPVNLARINYLLIFSFLILSCSNPETVSKESDSMAPKIEKKETIEKEKPLPGLFSFASERPLELNELIKFKIDGLKLIRNEIYARHGYIFQSKEINDYFIKTEWYTPKFNDISSKLSTVEVQNITIIRKLEKLIEGELLPKEGFEFYQAIFPKLQLPFEIMTENESSYTATVIPDYLNQTSHHFNKVVGKIYEKDSVIALVVLEDVMQPPSFAPYYFNVYTFSKSGLMLDSTMIAYDEFDGYQSAIIHENALEVIEYQYQFGEEEGPNGLPEVDSIYKVNVAIYKIDDAGIIKLISSQESLD